MSDANSVPAVQNDLRSPAIAVYVLYLAAVLSAGLAGIVGVIIAYVKRDDAKGTIWESHFRNQIVAFWGWLLMFVVGCLTIWVFFIGVGIVIVAFAWFLYRTIKGLIRISESKPYA